MSFPSGAPGSFTTPPLEGAASAALAAVRQRMGSGRPFPAGPPPALTPQEKQDALATIASGGGCGICGGIHAAAEHGCPRLSSFKLDGDGRIVEGTFWPDGQWDRGAVVFAEDAAEKEAGDGAH